MQFKADKTLIFSIKVSLDNQFTKLQAEASTSTFNFNKDFNKFKHIHFT